MGSGVPVLSAAEVERILLSLGFTARSGKGAHRFYRHPDGRTTTVPVHAGNDISPSLRKICKDVHLTIEEFLEHRQAGELLRKRAAAGGYSSAAPRWRNR